MPVIMNTNHDFFLSIDKQSCHPETYLDYGMDHFLTKDCCSTKTGKCGQNEGNCEKNSDCLPGHRCGTNNCKY